MEDIAEVSIIVHVGRSEGEGSVHEIRHFAGFSSFGEVPGSPAEFREFPGSVKHPMKVHAWAGVSYHHGKEKLYLVAQEPDDSLYSRYIRQSFVPQSHTRPARPALVCPAEQRSEAQSMPRRIGSHQNRPSPSAKSPDLSPMKHVWKLTKDHVVAQNPQSATALRTGSSASGRI